MPAPRRSDSPRSRGNGQAKGGQPRSGAASRRSGANDRRTDANERRAPARPRGENPYKRAAKGEAPRGVRGRSTSGGSTDRKPAKPKAPAPKGWGSLTRKGAQTVREPGMGRASSRQAERIERPPVRGEQEQWVREPQKTRSRANNKARPSEAFVLPKDAIAEIEERAGKRADRLVRNLRDAAKAYAAERWGDVRKSLAPLLKEVGDAPVVLELNGMLLYRTGKWSAALKDLEAAHLAIQTYDLYPAMMDAHRALKHAKKVLELWDELREASPSGEVMAEGRIVMAASLADQGRVQDAIRLLEKTTKPRGEPKLYQLRSWYALADLYERKGDVGKARQLFDKVASHDPGLADVVDRLDALN